MDPSGKALVIGGVVGSISRVAVAGGLSGKFAIWASLAITTIAVALFGWSAGDLNRSTSFGYFSLWAEVLLIAAGSFHLIEEGEKINADRKLPVILLAAALASLTLVGCGGNPPPRIAPLPAQVEVANRDVTAVAGNLQQLLTMAAEAVNTVSKIEDEAATSGVIPTAADAVFDRAMRDYADASNKASNGITAAALQGWPQLRALVQPVLDKGQGVIDAAYQLGAIKSKVSNYLKQLGDVLSAAVGEFMFGGAR